VKFPPAKGFLLAVFATTAAVGLMLRPASACTDGASPTETAFATTFPSCDQTDILILAHDYALTQDDSWVPAGLKDDCNLGLPFAKVLNAVIFIGLGPHFQLGGFHDSIDYLNESRSHRSAFHGNFYLRFIQQGALPTSEADSETGRFQKEDRTNLHCPIFNLPSGGGTSAGFLAERAAVLVHEAWHHWQHANGLSTNHITGPIGNCPSKTGAACDYYYYHAQDFQFPDGSLSSQLGALNFNNCVPGVPCSILGIPAQPTGYTHSAYQVMVEFSSDMANWANPFIVPFVNRLEARLVGNGHIAQNFVNVVPYVIGKPVPFPKVFKRQNP
jgi:hypothetical protein